MTSEEVGIHVCAHLSISSEIDVCSEVCSSIDPLDPLNVYSIEIAELRESVHAVRLGSFRDSHHN